MEPCARSQGVNQGEARSQLPDPRANANSEPTKRPYLTSLERYGHGGCALGPHRIMLGTLLQFSLGEQAEAPCNLRTGLELCGTMPFTSTRVSVSSAPLWRT